MSICPASGFFIQSTPGGNIDKGNFEVVLPSRQPHGGLLHYWRDNNHKGYPWRNPNHFATQYFATAVTLFESDHKAHQHNDEYNLEVFFVTPGNRSISHYSPPDVHHYWRENGGAWAWQSAGAGGATAGVANPCIVAIRLRPSPTTTEHEAGGYEIVVPSAAGGFDHGYGLSVFAHVPGPRLSGAAFLLSYVHSGGVRGNPMSGDRVVAAISTDGALMLFLLRGLGGRAWEGPFVIGRDVLQGIAGSDFAGQPSIIMSDLGEYVPSDWNLPGETATYGNYELIAPLRRGGIAHFYKQNGEVYGGIFADLDDNNINAGWHGYQVFGTAIYKEVSMIQSSLGSGDHGHLEVVARRADQEGFDFFWRDDDLRTWHGPVEVPG